MSTPRLPKPRRAPALDSPWEAAYDRMLAKRVAAEAAAKKAKAEPRTKKAPTA